MAAEPEPVAFGTGSTGAGATGAGGSSSVAWGHTGDGDWATTTAPNSNNTSAAAGSDWASPNPAASDGGDWGTGFTDTGTAIVLWFQLTPAPTTDFTPCNHSHGPFSSAITSSLLVYTSHPTGDLSSLVTRCNHYHFPFSSIL